MTFLTILLVILLSHSLVARALVHESDQSFKAVVVPIIRRPRVHSKPRTLLRRGSQTGAIGLGDFADNEYSIQITVGSRTVPVIFDTGSSDLWAISTACSPESCGESVDRASKLDNSDLQGIGLAVEMKYGDSAHPTFASGQIGTANVKVAGLSVSDQAVAGIDTTNTSLSDQGLSGIFGIGFPNPVSGSVIFQTLLESFPTATGEADVALTDSFINTLPTKGPFTGRLVTNGLLKAPMFTVTLEREDIDISGNIGQLTIGSMPNGVSEDALTWVPVRLYTVEQGGIAGSSQNPNEVFPARWEIPIDDVILNGQTLPKPDLPNGVSYTALIDSGTSFIAGPTAIVDQIYSTISGISPQAGDTQVNPPSIPCNVPVHLSFVIGGKVFPVDPRDFLSVQDRASDCNAGSLLPTDPPSTGALMSWILGDPFMKSNFIAFYYGNLTNPSVDPPRMGFLSTVPTNADAELSTDVQGAANGFTVASVAAPVGTFSAISTDAQGVPQAPSGVPLDTGRKGGASRSQVSNILLSCIALHLVSLVLY